MRIHLPFPRHTQTTPFIALDTSACQAFWKCVEACPQGVIGSIVFLAHRHARIDHAEKCKGCKKCVNVCPNAAIRYTCVPPGRG
jgi:NAD-dependent dihydropyrimidine dehydrogenase PreA subunit